MEKIGVSKYTVSFGLSLALTSVINALLAVAKEKIPAVMTGLQKLTGHHWVSHSAIILLLFAAFGWSFARADGGRGIQITANRLIEIITTGVVAGGLMIIAFYLIGD